MVFLTEPEMHGPDLLRPWPIRLQASKRLATHRLLVESFRHCAFIPNRFLEVRIIQHLSSRYFSTAKNVQQTWNFTVTALYLDVYPQWSYTVAFVSADHYQPCPMQDLCTVVAVIQSTICWYYSRCTLVPIMVLPTFA
jgi:hypothetical protein